MFKSVTPRVSLFFISLIAKAAYSALSGDSFSASQTKSAWGVLFWILWFVMLWLVTLPQTDIYFERFSRQLKFVARSSVIVSAVVCIAIAGSYFGLKADIIHAADFPEPIGSLFSSLETQPRYSDGAALTFQATESIINGENPYAQSNVVTAMNQFDGPFINLTPLQEGRFSEVFPYPSQTQLADIWAEAQLNTETVPVELETRLNYPAGSFLLTAPFVLAGVDTLQVILIIFMLIAVIYALWRIPGEHKLIFGLAVLISMELWISGFIGLDKRVLIFPFMLIGWLLIPERPKIAMALLGVAAAAFQTAWFLLPFALIFAYHRWGLKKAAQGAVITIGVFLAFNLPFVFADPELWLSSVLAPMTDSLYPMGVGLAGLVESGILQIETSTLFTILEAAALAGGLLWYFLRGRNFPETGLLLSILPLFFAWRSLSDYFFYVDLIVLASLLLRNRSGQVIPGISLKAITRFMPQIHRN
ncbi:hypothetical protein DGWBC_1228 [Dehalogenimonas sp. WBC-2]|nr:hypothetical protein DGWBC_1228 [Dehalogenimonas sp. WBC-2]